MMHARLELVDPNDPLDIADDLLGRYVRVSGVDDVDPVVPARHQTRAPAGVVGGVELFVAAAADTADVRRDNIAGTGLQHFFASSAPPIQVSGEDLAAMRGQR